MRGRRRLPVDKRPNWRDPNMPVLVKTQSGDLVEWTPEQTQRAFAFKLANSGWPEWRDDPVYDLKKRRRR